MDFWFLAFTKALLVKAERYISFIILKRIKYIKYKSVHVCLDLSVEYLSKSEIVRLNDSFFNVNS